MNSGTKTNFSWLHEFIFLRSNFIKHVFLGCCWVLASTWGMAQTELQSSEQAEFTEIEDTIQYANYLQREMEDIITDTTLQGNFHTTGLIEDHWPHLMTLGYSGSPVYGPQYHIPENAGWNLGFHAFDPYRKNFEDLLFIRDGLPITKVTYLQTPQVNQSIFNGYFARKINDVSFAIDHNRYNYTGDYLNQKSFNTIFHTGLTMEKEKWYGYFLFASEVFQQNNNGGITTDSLYFGSQEDIYDNRSAYPVQFQNGLSRDDSKSGRAGLMFKALRFRNYGVNVGAQVDASQRQISITSEGPKEKDSFFPNYKITGVNGLNTYLKNTSVLPAAVVEFSDSARSVFTLRSLTGIHLNQLKFIDQSRNWQEFVQQGDLNFQSAYIDLNSHLDLRIFDNNVYFDLSGEIATNWKGFGVSGQAALKRTAAPWLYRYQTFSGDVLWDNSPPSMFTQLLGGAIRYKSEKIEARVTLTQLFQSNLSYLNERGIPDTINNQTSVSLTPELNLHLGIFHLENELALNSSDAVHPYYPTLSGRHSVYIEDKWFKNRMHLNLGISVYWKNAHQGYYYLPYVQSFVPGTQTMAAEYRVNPFFSFRVRTFKFFVRMENSNLFWQKKTILYDTYHYPLMDPAMRLGIEWIFRD